jgi:hypothetical protein
MMTHQEWWQLAKFEETSRRMTPRLEVIVGIEGTSSVAWLAAADIVVGQHRTRRAAGRWIESVQRRYPGCLLAVAFHRRGRWCLVGLPARNILVRGGRFDLETAEQLGRAVYYLWAARCAGL